MKKMLVLMELHLDASIDKLDNLAMNVQIDKEKRIENTKNLKQTEPERAEAERVEAEIVNSPMVAEPQEYQYNADAFEARGVDEVKQEAAHKEVSKVRDFLITCMAAECTCRCKFTQFVSYHVFCNVNRNKFILL